MTFRLEAERGNPVAIRDFPLLSCTWLSDDEVYDGELRDGVMSAERQILYNCEGTGVVIFTFGFRGERE